MTKINNKWKQYTGILMNVKRNGNGTLIFSNGDQLIGNFKEDIIDGEAKFVFMNGK